MKENVLDANNRAALQGLIALASALGIGALLSGSFFALRGAQDRDVGFTVFESFSIVAILTTAAMTACFSLLLLHSGEAVSDTEFARAAAPLVVSTILLVLLTAASKFSSLPGGLSMHLPTASATLFIATALGVFASFLTPRPANTITIGIVILGVGACLAWFFLRLERFGMNGSQKSVRQRVATLSARGYQPKKVALRLAVPERRVDAEKLGLVCWSKGTRTYLDQTECRRLRSEVNDRWDELGAGETLPPVGHTVLTQIEIKTAIFPWPPKLLMVIETREQGKLETKRKVLKANEVGLFELTGWGWFEADSAPNLAASN